jgi:prophage antirepressor-like protein
VVVNMPTKHKQRLNLGLRGQAPWLVTEAGLYRLVMKSRKPEAEAFQEWVTGTVLPAIRKDGAYIKGEETAKSDDDPEIAHALRRPAIAPWGTPMHPRVPL